MDLDLSTQRVSPRSADRPLPSERVHADATYGPTPAASNVGAPELTIVVPTFNEAENVPVLIERIAKRLDGVELGDHHR